MNLFELVASVTLDTSGFTGGISDAMGAFNGLKDLVGKGLQMGFDFATDFAKDVFDTGMNFDRQMSSVQAVLGREEGTQENINRLRAFALDTAKDSIFTSEQAAEAYYYMGMAGWKSEQMMSGLPGVIALAAASGEDLGRVSDIVTDSITAFGLTADDVSMYVDLLAQTATNANTDVSRMGETFKYVAPIAGSLGADVDDVALSIGLMANAGIKGSMAGTALRNIFTRISTNAGETKTDLGALTILTEKLGVQFWDSSGKMRDWADIMNEARVSWRGLTQEEQVYYAKQIASQRGMAGWLALMNASDDSVKQLTNSLKNSKDAAQDMADVQLDNLWGDIQLFNSSLDILKVSIFDDVKGPMREVVQWATEALDRITAAVNEGGLISGIEQLGTEIEAAGEKFAPMLESLGKAAVPFVTGLLTNVIDPLSETAVKLGASLASGVLEGLETELDKRNLSWIGNLFGDSGRGILHWFNTDMSKGTGGLTSSGLNPLQIPEVHAETITFDGVEFTADQLREALENAVDDPIWGKQVELAGQKVSADVAQALLDSLADAGTNGGQQMGDNIFAQLNTDVPEWATLIANAIGLSGTTAGDQMDGNIYAKIISAAPSWASYISSKLGSAGSDAGNGIAGGIQRVLSATSFGVSIVGTVTNIINRFKTKKYAQATNEGRILRGATIFGYDQDGNALQGGEAGNEAVIGTQSLSRLITDAVRKGGNSSARPITINVYQQPGESAERLVSEIQREFIRIDQAARSYV